MQQQPYSPEQTQLVVNEYKLGKTPKEIADQLNRSERSVIAKLSREGVYQSQPKPEPRLRKVDLIAQIAALLGQAGENFDSFEKCSRDQLLLLLSCLQQR